MEFLFIIIVLLLIIRLWKSYVNSRISIGFLHPYCNSGGGGERVLWIAVKELFLKYGDAIDIIIYTGDLNEVSSEEILSSASSRFNVNFKYSPRFVKLHSRSLVEPQYWPYFTLLGQSLASILMAFEVILRHPPIVFFDSMGYTFTLPFMRFIAGCYVGCYVHYPTISRDMIEVVSNSSGTYNHSKIIASSAILKTGKLIYYKIFAQLYGWMGKLGAHVTLVNSSWTRNHVDSIWGIKSEIVYPPCNVSHLTKLPSQRQNDFFNILSIAQFRPEKNHALQLEAFSRLLKNLPQGIGRDMVKLQVAGSVRHSADEARVQELRKLATCLGIETSVEFLVNISFEELMTKMSQATIGIHTMWNEHFGIGVVEMMAAGLVVLAHESGGPSTDIVTVSPSNKRTGFLATRAQEYADVMFEILKMEPCERLIISSRAVLSVERFSDKHFSDSFLRNLQSIIPI